jgi:hypothetical protein
MEVRNNYGDDDDDYDIDGYLHDVDDVYYDVHDDDDDLR